MVDPLAVPRDPSAQAEDRFLLEATRAIALGAPDACPSPPSPRWVDRARPHGILGPVLALLRSAGHDAPPGLAERRVVAAVRAVGMGRDLRTVGAALDRVGVPWVVVKGPVLGDLIYQRRGTRESSDLDVLVSPSQLRAAVSVLVDEGAVILGADWSQRTWARGAEVPLELPSGTVLDLHWHLLNRPGMRRAFGFDPEDVLSRRTRRAINGLEVWTPDDLDLVLHVLLHACLDGCGRLRAMLDAQQCVVWLRDRGRDPTDLAVRARRHRVEAPVRAVIIATADHLDPSLAPWALAARGTSWTRMVTWLSRRPSGSPLDSGLTRRLYRYTTPRTWGSITGVGGYAASRVVRVISPDRTELHASPTSLADVAFQQFLRRVENHGEGTGPAPGREGARYPAEVPPGDDAAGAAAPTDRLVAAYHRSIRVRLRWRRVAEAVFDGVWLGLLDPVQRRALDTAHYATSTEEVDGVPVTYSDASHIRQGLSGWERGACAQFDPGGTVVVTSAGAGREVLGLTALGFDVVGYEPNPSLVSAGKSVLPDPNRLRQSGWDEFPAVDGQVDAVVIGWGSYMHVDSRDKRVALLRGARQALRPGGKLLVSYFHRPRSRYFDVVATLGSALRRLRHRDPLELGDALSPAFVHYFTPSEVIDELDEAGFDVVTIASVPYGHALARRRD